jgi:hypothetical protein
MGMGMGMGASISVSGVAWHGVVWCDVMDGKGVVACVVCILRHIPLRERREPFFLFLAIPPVRMRDSSVSRARANSHVYRGTHPSFTLNPVAAK